jgi:hypothetical protein
VCVSDRSFFFSVFEHVKHAILCVAPKELSHDVFRAFCPLILPAVSLFPAFDSKLSFVTCETVINC